MGQAPTSVGMAPAAGRGQRTCGTLPALGEQVRWHGAEGSVGLGSPHPQGLEVGPLLLCGTYVTSLG